MDKTGDGSGRKQGGPRTRAGKRADEEKPALVPHDAKPATERRTNEFTGLTPDGRHDLAVQRIRGLWGTAAQAVVGIGQTLLEACHDGDESAALAPEADASPLFNRISRSLGTLEGGPSHKTLSLARRVAAATDARLGHFWTVVPYTHKTKLVELESPKQMATGAKLAVEFGWTVDQTEAWVRGERAKEGDAPKKRGRNLVTTAVACDHVADASSVESLARLGDQYAKLPVDKRRKIREALKRAAEALVRIQRRLAAVDQGER